MPDSLLLFPHREHPQPDTVTQAKAAVAYAQARCWTRYTRRGLRFLVTPQGRAELRRGRALIASASLVLGPTPGALERARWLHRESRIWWALSRATGCVGCGLEVETGARRLCADCAYREKTHYRRGQGELDYMRRVS